MSHAALAYAPARTATPPVRPAAPAAPAPRRPAGSGSYGAIASADRYRDAELAAATPGQLVVMLLDRCVLTVRRAETAFAVGDVEARVAHLCRAADMLAELRASLDFDAGGALSGQLDALYAFAAAELFAANRHQAPARLGPVVRVLGNLRDGFAGAQAELAATPPRAGA